MMQSVLLATESCCLYRCGYVMLQYFENKCNLELASKLQSSKTEWQHMRTTQRVKEGLKMRLEMNAPYIGELQSC